MRSGHDAGFSLDSPATEFRQVPPSSYETQSTTIPTMNEPSSAYVLPRTMVVMPIAPPLFIWADADLDVFDSVHEAQTWLEPVDVSEHTRGFDAEGRLLTVSVVGQVKLSRVWYLPWLHSIDQHKASVRIELAEEQPTHGEELRRALIAVLTREGEAGLPSGTSLAKLKQLAYQQYRVGGRQA